MITLSRSIAQRTQNYFEPIRQLIDTEYRNDHIPVTVISIRNESSDMFTLSLKVNAPRDFDFRPGQHIQLHLKLDGRYVSRIFSISSPHSDYKKRSIIELSIKPVADGLVTNHLNEDIKPGQTLHISKPLGDFTVSKETLLTPTLFVAAGSGITPIISILRSLDRKYLNNAFLLYYNSNDASIAFNKEIQSLTKYGLRASLINTTTNGRLTTEHINDIAGDCTIQSAYICGPAGLKNLAEQSLDERSNQTTDPMPAIRSEHFCVEVPSENTAYSLNVIGKKDQQQLTQSKGSLLDNIERTSFKPISGCKAGICHQCSATLMNGRARNILTNQLHTEPGEEVQLCICVAESNIELKIKERAE